MCRYARAICQLVLVNVSPKWCILHINTALGDDREMDLSAIKYE